MARTNYYPKPRIVVEQSPWQSFFESLPNTMLSFMQLSHQIEQDRIDKEYRATREDLAFERQQYSLVKERENKWIDTLSTMGFSTEHITGPGTESILSVSDDISNLTSATEQNISKLRAFSAELDTWKEKGKEWEKEFASFEDETRENEYRNLVLEGGAFLYTKEDKTAGKIPKGKKVGDVYGTGEFAEALKSLSSIEMEKLKDINIRKAIKKGLRLEVTAIKDWSALMAGQKVASEIGQKRSGVLWQNIIRTADKYSGRENIRVNQSDLMKYGEYQDAAGNLTLEGRNLELQKAAIGREYEYLVMGRYTDLPENATEEQAIKQHRKQLLYYNTMVSDFDVAKPTAGGYGKQGSPGNQIRLKETIAAAYNNYQSIIAGGNKDEADIFSTKALKYLGVNFNDPATIEELDLEATLDRNLIDDEILASLDYTKRLDEDTLGPAYWDPEFNEEPNIGPSIPEGGLPVAAEDVGSSYYQQGKDYYDKATEAVWGPEVAGLVKAIPMYKAGRAVTSGAATAVRGGVDVLNQALFDIGATAYNIPGVILNQLIRTTGYSPGFSGEREMQRLLGWTGAGPHTDPDYSFGTYTPEGGFWTKEMSAALDQLSSSSEQLSRPDFKYVSQKRRKAIADSLATIDTLAAAQDTTAAPVTDAEMQELSSIYMNSPFLRSKSGLSFKQILDDFHASGIKDATDYIMDRFEDYIEADLIR